MSPIVRINEMLGLASSKNRLFPATVFYNEGWLLRLVLDWFSRHRSPDHPLNFETDARWFSEALLPSQFFSTKKGDNLAEGWTHADGVIGHVNIGHASLADTKLANNSTQFIVTEAKMFSPLSSRVTNAAYFDQAARNVACMAEVLSKANRRPDDMSSLGFFVIAPKEQISSGTFARELASESIRGKVSRRVAEYEQESKNAWYQDWFLPVLNKVKIETISWEATINLIRTEDSAFGSGLSEFYADCLRFNQIQEREPQLG